jgi:hypothetical protein
VVYLPFYSPHYADLQSNETNLHGGQGAVKWVYVEDVADNVHDTSGME